MKIPTYLMARWTTNNERKHHCNFFPPSGSFLAHYQGCSRSSTIYPLLLKLLFRLHSNSSDHKVGGLQFTCQSILSVHWAINHFIFWVIYKPVSDFSPKEQVKCSHCRQMSKVNNCHQCMNGSVSGGNSIKCFAWARWQERHYKNPFTVHLVATDQTRKKVIKHPRAKSLAFARSSGSFNLLLFSCSSM